MSDASDHTPDGKEREMEASQEEHARRWRVIRASVQGTSHAKTGQPCQDSSSVGVGAPDGMLVAAVADGAGSATLSADGSRIAACAATKRAIYLMRLHVQPFYEGVLEKILRESIRSARKELKAEANRQNKSLREFATTLIVAICTREITGAAQVGDGAVVAAGEGVPDDGYALFSAPQRGEYANTTNFITSDSWQNSLAVKMRYGSVKSVAMFTDGIQPIALVAAADNAPYAPFFDPLFSWMANQNSEYAASDALKDFLSSPRVTARTGDDLTLLLATLP